MTSCWCSMEARGRTHSSKLSSSHRLHKSPLLVITKLDGTAKGGVVIGISDQLKVPVRYIGLGEGMEDLQLFNKEQFVDSLFKQE